MKKDDNFSISFEKFLFLGILIGFCIYALNENILVEITAIIANILLIIFIIFILQRRYRQKFVTIIENLVINISQAADKDKELIADEKSISEVKQLYEVVEGMRDKLKKQSRLKEATFRIVNTLAINIDLQTLINDILPKIIEGSGSNWGAFYLYNSATNKLEIKNSLGFSKNIYKEFDLVLGEGFIGSKLPSKEIFVIKDIPDDTVYISKTFIGTIKPKSIMVVPIFAKEEFVSILVLGSIFEYSQEEVQIMREIRHYLGVAIINGRTYEREQRASKELQFQNQMIQNLSDELEMKLMEKTDFLKGIINSERKDAFIVLNKSGEILEWNSGAEFLKGYKAEKVVGNNISILYSEEDMRSGKLERIFKTAKEQGIYEERSIINKKGDSVCYVSVKVVPVYKKNNEEIIGYSYTIKDITNIVKLEKNLNYERRFNEKLIETSTRALILTSSNGTIKCVNISAETILGEYNENLQNRNVAEFFKDSEEFRRNVYDVVKLGGKKEYSKVLVTEAGEEQDINVTITRLIEREMDIDDEHSSIMIRLQKK